MNTLPESLRRHIDGVASAELRRCTVSGCTGYTLSGRFCTRCAEEIDAPDVTARHAEHRAHPNWLRRRWDTLMNWVPGDEQIKRIDEAARCADWILKTAVIAGAIYIALQVGRAFLPGGPGYELVIGGR